MDPTNTTFGDLQTISSVRPKPLRQIQLANNVIKFIKERDNKNKGGK